MNINLNLGASNFFGQTFYRPSISPTKLISAASSTEAGTAQTVYQTISFIPSNQIYENSTIDNIDASINHVLQSLAQAGNNNNINNNNTTSISRGSDNTATIIIKTDPIDLNQPPTIEFKPTTITNQGETTIVTMITNDLATAIEGSSNFNKEPPQKQHQQTIFPCEQCSKPLRSKQSLAVHLKTHSKPFSCNICHRRFAHRMLQQLQEHSHERKEQKTIEESNRPYKCVVAGCGRCFLQQHKLTAHLKIHSGTYTCNLCSRGFSSNAFLSRHTVGVHGDEKPFKCPATGCQKSFSHSSYLSRHLKSVSHSGEKRFGCFICNKSYASQRALNYHLISTHAEAIVSDPRPPGPPPGPAKRRKKNNSLPGQQ